MGDSQVFSLVAKLDFCSPSPTKYELRIGEFSKHRGCRCDEIRMPFNVATHGSYILIMRSSSHGYYSGKIPHQAHGRKMHS